MLTQLWREHGFSVTISGHRPSWQAALDAEAFAAMSREGELYAEHYRLAIWRSKINLSFLTHANLDEFVHKSFEIAGCGSFLLAERSPGHSARFREDVEAAFFSNVEECAEKIRRYLPDEAARRRIAAAGHARGVIGEYHNDGQVGAILHRLKTIVPAVRSSAEARA
jgi:spore maturation protein CgeB